MAYQRFVICERTAWELAAFLWGKFESKEKGNAVTFRISCLHDDFIEDSVVHVLVRDEATGKTIESNRLRLKDAEPTRRPSMSEEAIPAVERF